MPFIVILFSVFFLGMPKDKNTEEMQRLTTATDNCSNNSMYLINCRGCCSNMIPYLASPYL